ncbi:MAG: hypothetical protein ABW202_14305 [Duganella sp.]
MAAALGKTAETRRVAVIAIHGVADQLPGETAQQLAHLLAASSHVAGNSGGRYGDGVRDSVVLGVPLLRPTEKLPEVQDSPDQDYAVLAAAATTASPPSDSGANAVRKPWRSTTSDFQYEGWQALQASSTSAANSLGLALTAKDGAGTVKADLGTGFSDYLLRKAADNSSPDAAYEATRIRMRRTANDRVEQVDVHEMYWADLSRLSGNVPRIIDELFTLLFRFSRLGRDAIDQTVLDAKLRKLPTAKRWASFARLQTALDWTFTMLLSQLFLQVFVVLAAMALIQAAHPYAKIVHGVLAAALPMAAISSFYFHHPGSWVRRWFSAALAIAGTLLLLVTPYPLLLGISVLGLLSALCIYGLNAAEQRFPKIRLSGLLFLGFTLEVMLGEAVRLALGVLPPGGEQIWLQAAMRAFEILLIGIIIWWVLVPFIMLAWLVRGAVMIRRDPTRRAAVITGQLAVFISLTVFLTLAMALWTVLTHAVTSGTVNTPYQPLVFGEGSPWLFSKDTPLACINGGDWFLLLRLQKSTQAFAIVTALPAILAVYVAIMLIPSALTEVFPGKHNINAQALGRWLSRGYAGLDNTIRLIVVIAVPTGMLFGVLILLNRMGRFPEAWFGELSAQIESLSQHTLSPLMLGATTVTAVFVAFGGLLSRTVPWLRLPLDVALDVDNHFREFPRRAIPRARIFSRYVALLEHLVDEGYDDIVIVAHSQGAVITAELLRYLRYRAAHTDNQDQRVAQLWQGLERKVSLLTAGCPLRQLYAARFPAQYAWVHEQAASPDSSTAAPATTAAIPASCAALGVQRWINLYMSGDYVGRWLWSPAETAQELDAAILYEASGLPPHHQHRQLDVCLGSGAHTHYFDVDQRHMAQWIDAIIGAAR